MARYFETKCFHPNGAACTAAELPVSASIKTGREVRREETLFDRNDGTRGTMNIESEAVRDADGVVIAAVMTCEDITEQKLLAEREHAARLEAESAKAASRMKDDFLAMVSHELRTPLTPIISAALRGVIEQCIENALPAAKLKNIEIKQVLEERIPASCDAQRVSQALSNLLANATKFTPDHGRIDVRGAVTETHAEVSVKDTGIGMTPEFLPHVFDRFRQADASKTRLYGGLGLGLAIVRQLIEAQGGSVVVESPGQNQGTTFTLRLPLQSL